MVQIKLLIYFQHFFEFIFNESFQIRYLEMLKVKLCLKWKHNFNFSAKNFKLS